MESSLKSFLAAFTVVIITYLISNAVLAFIIYSAIQFMVSSGGDAAPLAFGGIILLLLFCGQLIAIWACCVVAGKVNKRSTSPLSDSKIFLATIVILLILWSAAYFTSLAFTAAPSTQHAKNVISDAINLADPTYCAKLPSYTASDPVFLRFVLKIYSGPLFSFREFNSAEVDHSITLSIRNQSYILYYKESRTEEFCQTMIAVAKGDSTLCPTTTPLPYSSGPSVYETCLIEIAKNPPNMRQTIEVCQSIHKQNYKDECVKNVAISTKNADVCMDVSDTYEKDSCYGDVADAARDPKVCGRLSRGQISEDYCIKQVANSAENPTFCEYVSNQSIKDECYFRIIYDSLRYETEKNKDPNLSPNLCLKITDKSLKYDCYDFFVSYSGFAGESASECQAETSVARDYCYFTLAALWKNDGLCTSIADTTMRGNCEDYAKYRSNNPRYV